MGIRRSIMGFDQEEVLKLKKTITKEIRGVEKQVEIKLDLQDLLILKQIADFPNRKAITKVIIQDEIFFWVSYKQLIEELPILDIGKQALSDRLDKMSKLGLLKRTFQTIGGNSNMTFFKMGDAYESLRYKKDEKQSEECKEDGYRSQTRDGIVSEYDTCRSQLRDINISVNKESVLELVDKEEKDKSFSKKTYDLSFVDGKYMSTFTEWLEYKAERKEKYKTESSLKACYNRLLKLSGDNPQIAAEIVQQSIANNYAGLFEYKEMRTQKPKPKTQEEINREKLNMPILNDDGDLPDGTFFKNGHRWYFSKRDKKAYSIPPDAVPRPNDRSEYDLTRKDWYVPRDEWEASDEIW